MTIFKACKNGNIEMVKLLLSNGANIDAIDNDNWTPLHWVIGYKNIEMVKLLIKSGANINAINKYNQTPLHLACYCRNIEIIKLLVLNNANIDAIDSWNETPLQYLNDENKQIINHFINALKYLKNN